MVTTPERFFPPRGTMKIAEITAPAVHLGELMLRDPIATILSWRNLPALLIPWHPRILQVVQIPAGSRLHRRRPRSIMALLSSNRGARSLPCPRRCARGVCFWAPVPFRASCGGEVPRRVEGNHGPIFTVLRENFGHRGRWLLEPEA